MLSVDAPGSMTQRYFPSLWLCLVNAAQLALQNCPELLPTGQTACCPISLKTATTSTRRSYSQCPATSISCSSPSSTSSKYTVPSARSTSFSDLDLSFLTVVSTHFLELESLLFELVEFVRLDVLLLALLVVLELVDVLTVALLVVRESVEPVLAFADALDDEALAEAELALPDAVVVLVRFSDVSMSVMLPPTFGALRMLAFALLRMFLPFVPEMGYAGASGCSGFMVWSSNRVVSVETSSLPD